MANFIKRTTDVGYSTIISKRMLLPEQKAVDPDTEMPGQRSVDRDLDLGLELTHRHFGMAKEHPVALRHGKSGMDALHKEEDKLVDEYRDLFAKARQGVASHQDIARAQEIKRALGEMNQRRLDEARTILEGLNMGSDRVSGHAPVRQPQPRPVHGHDVHGSMAKSPYGSKPWKGPRRGPRHRPGIGSSRFNDDSISLADAVGEVEADDLGEYDSSLFDPWDENTAYGDDSVVDVIPENDGSDDAVKRSNRVYADEVDGDVAHTAYPDKVEDTPVVAKALVFYGLQPTPFNQRVLEKADERAVDAEPDGEPDESADEILDEIAKGPMGEFRNNRSEALRTGGLGPKIDEHRDSRGSTAHHHEKTGSSARRPASGDWVRHHMEEVRRRDDLLPKPLRGVMGADERDRYRRGIRKSLGLETGPRPVVAWGQQKVKRER
jgi:hypothetical protein